MKKIILQVEEYCVKIYYDDAKESSVIAEAKNRGVPFSGPYSAREDKVGDSMGQDHLHIYLKNNQLFALNKDGTAHDGSHGVRIPNKAAKAISKNFPSFSLPDGNIIEVADITDEIACYLCED